MENKRELLASIESFSRITKTSVSVLKEMKDSIDKVHKVKSIVKGAGLFASIAGGALVIGAIGASFFTGGASLVALTGAGTILSLGGGVANISADVFNIIYSKIKNSNLEEIVEKRKNAAERFCRNMTEIRKIVKILKDADRDLSEEDASEIAMTAYMIGYNAANFENEFSKIKNTFNEIKKNGINRKTAWILAVYAIKEGKTVYDVISSSKTILDNFGTLSKFCKGKTLYSGLLRNGGMFWKNMRLVSETMVTILKIGKKTAMTIVKGSTIAISGFFMGLEIKDFINTCKENHPISNAISKLLETMEKEIEVLKSLHDVVSV